MNKKKVLKIISKLELHYPNAKCSLNFSTSAELLVATMLSAQCTDKQVNKVTPQLFAEYPSVRELAEADIEKIKEIIRPTGFYNNKAKSIKESMFSLQKKYNGMVPDSLKELTQLAGVGRKTANVVLGDAFGIPGIVVDTHVKRIANRLGFTKSENVEKIEQDLMKSIDRDKWTLFGHMVIEHGRKYCKARKPICDKCFLQEECLFYDE